MYWGCGGKLLSIAGVVDLFDMIPAMAAAGPCGEAGWWRLDGGSGSGSTPRVVSGEGAAGGDLSLAAPVISM